MISVCIAAFNGEKYLGKELDSILPQLCCDDEVIIVDDCSSDDTVNIINKINDNRIKLIRNEKNVGVNKSFELAILQAKGDIIFLADQDDIWLINKVEVIKRYFQNDDELYLLHHDAVVRDENGKLIADSFYKWRGYVGPGWFKNILRDTHLGCCMAFRRDLIEKIMPISNIGYHDRWIGICTSLFGLKEVYIDDRLIYYIRHDNTTTSYKLKRRKLIDIVNDRILLIRDIINFLRNRDEI